MLDGSLREWLDAHAEALDLGTRDAECIVPRLAAAGMFGIGVPASVGGSGGHALEAMRAVAEVAQHSLTAAFVFWGQRTFVEYLVQGQCPQLRERFLGALVRGEIGGATGLSNAMKYLAGIEELSVRAVASGAGFRLSGRLPWVTNLRKEGFLVACAVAREAGTAAVFALPHDARGVARSNDLALVGLRASDTAALQLDDVELDKQWMIDGDGPGFLRKVRPVFLSLQCGLALGLTRAALRQASEHAGEGRAVLASSIDERGRELEQLTRELTRGLLNESFHHAPARLFDLRLRLTELALRAVQLELEVRGGRAYLEATTGGFARRWREACFLPVVTPSAVQLRAELARQPALESA